MIQQTTQQSVTRVAFAWAIVIIMTAFVVFGAYLAHHLTGGVQHFAYNASASDTLAKVIFIFPILAASIVFMRLVLGFGTFGVFAPIVIGLALYQFGSSFMGLLAFVGFIGLGILFKYFVIGKLKLPAVSELALTMSFLAATYYLVYLVSLYMDLGFNAMLFPMIITGFLIERASDLIELKGMKEALKAFSGTLITSFVFSYFFLYALEWPFETLLVLSATSVVITVAVSQYVGIRLSEVVRFQPVID